MVEKKDFFLARAAHDTMHQSPLQSLGTIARKVKFLAPSSDAPLDGLELEEHAVFAIRGSARHDQRLGSNLLVFAGRCFLRSLIRRATEAQKLIAYVGVFRRGVGRLVRVRDLDLIVLHGAFERRVRKVVLDFQPNTRTGDHVEKINEVGLAPFENAGRDPQLRFDDLEVGMFCRKLRGRDVRAFDRVGQIEQDLRFSGQGMAASQRSDGDGNDNQNTVSKQLDEHLRASCSFEIWGADSTNPPGSSLCVFRSFQRSKNVACVALNVDDRRPRRR